MELDKNQKKATNLGNYSGKLGCWQIPIIDIEKTAPDEKAQRDQIPLQSRYLRCEASTKQVVH